MFSSCDWSLTLATSICIFCALRFAWIASRLALRSESSSLMMVCPLVTFWPSLKGMSMMRAETRAEMRRLTRGSISPGDET